METMKYGTRILIGIILSLAWTACHDFFHELIPPDDNQITELKLEGQHKESNINHDNNTIKIPWNKEIILTKLSHVSLPAYASLLPLTEDYVKKAFPGREDPDNIISSIKQVPDEGLTAHVTNLIKQNQDFNVPVMDKQIDFSSPVSLLVISGRGTVRRYTVNVVINVTFESNGGDNVETQEVMYETTVSRSPDPSKTDSSFLGWFRDNNTFDIPWNFNADTVPGDITLYAKWKLEKKYTVTFNSNGGNGTVPASQTVEADQDITLPDGSGLTRDGYTFEGWNTEADGKGDNYDSEESYTPTRTITLYAKWNPITYTVTYRSNAADAEGTTADSSHTYDVEKALTANGYSRKGYNFAGWNSESTGKGTDYTDEQNVKNLSSMEGTTVTLYAMWGFTVNFDANGGIGVTPASQTVQEDKTIDLPVKGGLTMDGYAFGGWNDNEKDKSYESGKPYKPTGNITLYARWNPITYTITYNKNAADAKGTTANSSHTYDAPKNLTPNDYSRTGYTFAGWYNPAGLGNYADKEIVTNLSSTAGATVTLYALWKPITYTVTYRSNAADAEGTTAESNHTYGVDGKLTKNKYTRTGYIFAGWNSESTGKGTDYTDEQNVKNLSSMEGTTVTLYAMWGFTVNFDANGGIGVTPASQTVQEDKTIDLPVKGGLTRNGYTFVGWYDNEKGETYDSGKPYTPTGNITLYAKWKPITYTVTYRSNAADAEGSMAPSEHTYDVSQDLTPNDYSRTGYNFAGWNSKNDGTGTNYSDRQSVKNLSSIGGTTVTLYAQWKPITYTVTYRSNAADAEGTMGDSSHTYGVDGKLTKNKYTRTGYIFAGWNTKMDGKGTDYTDEQNVKNLSPIGGATVTLYAKWNPITYTVTYDKNATDATGAMTPSKHTYDIPSDLTLNRYSRTGYTFVGWNTKADVMGPDYINGQNVTNLSSIGGATVTLYAQWKPNQISISLSVKEIVDGLPVLDDITISLTGTNWSETATITVEGQYTSIMWFYNNTEIPGSGPSLILDSSNTLYNKLGSKFLTVKVIKDNIPYSRTITFTVVK